MPIYNKINIKILTRADGNKLYKASVSNGNSEEDLFLKYIGDDDYELSRNESGSATFEDKDRAISLTKLVVSGINSDITHRESAVIVNTEIETIDIVNQ